MLHNATLKLKEFNQNLKMILCLFKLTIINYNTTLYTIKNSNNPTSCKVSNNSNTKLKFKCIVLGQYQVYSIWFKCIVLYSIGIFLNIFLICSILKVAYLLFCSVFTYFIFILFICLFYCLFLFIPYCHTHLHNIPSYIFITLFCFISFVFYFIFA